MDHQKKPWPTKDAMEQIYEMNLWGGLDHEFYSGSGSHNAELVDPYVDAVRSFLSSFKVPLTLCDLGCGDFNIGKQLLAHTNKYLAVDIVPALILRNKKVFIDPKLKFKCLDIAKDDLPAGDCAIIRQVMQHLSNAEVQNILLKLKQYKYLIVTEHIPQGEFKANADIISGRGIRLKKQSGLDLLAAPFNLQVKRSRQLLSIPLKDMDAKIDTTLYELH